MGERELTVPVWVEEPTGVEQRGQVLLGGVPLKQGTIYDGGWFALRRSNSSNGASFTDFTNETSFAVEGTPAAWWPDGSVKWLHLCGAVDLTGGRRNDFRLSEGAPAPHRGLDVQKRGRAVEVGGGALSVRLACEVGNVLQVRHGPSGRELLKSSGLSASLTLADPDGRPRPPIAWSFDDSNEPSAVVQSANRVVLRLPAKFIEAGRLVGEIIVFVAILREVSQLRLEPVFIYLGDPDRDLVAALAVTAHSVFGGDKARYGLANERGRGYWDVIQPVGKDEPALPVKRWQKGQPPQPRHGGPRWPEARLVQIGSSFYRIEKRTESGSSWVKAVEGQRSQGWCHLGDDTGGLTGAMRYFWQEYPRSLALNSDEGTVTFGLVPPQVPPLDLRRYSPRAWGRIMYETGDGPFPAQNHGATGIAKASELMLHFHDAGAADAAEQGLFFAHPCRLMTDAGYVADSRVVGAVASAPAPGFEAIEQRLAHLADFLIRERAVRGWYGLMDFGDVMSAFYSDKDRWAYDDGGYAWLNTESIPDWGLWLAGLRCGRADWLEAAIEMTRHNRDVDTYHRGELLGMGTRHNVNHWGCKDKEWRVTMPLVRRLHYYMTADPWTREVILATVARYQTYERTTMTGPKQSSALTGLMVKYEMTHDPADREVLMNLASAFAKAVRADGHFVQDLHANFATGEGHPIDNGLTMDGRYWFIDSFGAQHTLVELTELLGHRELSEALVRHARLILTNAQRPSEAGGTNVFAGMVFLALAWRLTGERSFREAIAEELRTAKEVEFEQIGGDGMLDDVPHEILANMKRRNKITCYIGNILHQYPFAMHALGEA